MIIQSITFFKHALSPKLDGLTQKCKTNKFSSPRHLHISFIILVLSIHLSNISQPIRSARLPACLLACPTAAGTTL